MDFRFIVHQWPLLIVALLWGISNPMMKKGGEGVTKIAKSESSSFKNFFMEYYYLFSRPLYICSFFLNICGSALFYYSLSNSDITMIATITNSLTFITTTLTGKLLGEMSNIYTYIGMVLVLIGVSLCMFSNEPR